MAKKTTKRTYTSESHYPLVKVLAFWSVIISGVLNLVSVIIAILDKIFENDNWAWARQLQGVFSLISSLALFCAIWLAGWDYVKTKSQAWRTVFIIFFVIALLGMLGVNVFGWLV